MLVRARYDFVVHYGKNATFAQRSVWLRRWCAAGLRAFDIKIEFEGTPPTKGVVAPNHLGYLDILVLAAITPQVFLAKSEVRTWPVFGWYARAAGTQFIVRARRADVINANAGFAAIVENSAVLTYFLEGTSTDGSRVLPFRSSLLASAIESHWPITPTAMRFTCVGGDPVQDVYWWGDMTLHAHVGRLLMLDATTAHVKFGEPVIATGERKDLAAALHTRVAALHADLHANDRR